jgi:hypothetical protein
MPLFNNDSSEMYRKIVAGRLVINLYTKWIGVAITLDLYQGGACFKFQPGNQLLRLRFNGFLHSLQANEQIIP